jgi:anti-sigma28 factor (negative regulator of flagellin synthesis)
MGIEVDRGAQSLSESIQNSNKNAGGSGSLPATSALAERRVHLGESYQEVRALAMLASRLPEVQQERVFALWQAVQSGHFDISAEEVAEAVLMHMVTHPRGAPE